MPIEFTNTVKIYPTHDYHFEVDITDIGTGNLSYHEDCPTSGDRKMVQIIYFRSSPDEMEAVAKAMLKLAREARGQ